MRTCGPWFLNKFASRVVFSVLFSLCFVQCSEKEYPTFESVRLIDVTLDVAFSVAQGFPVASPYQRNKLNRPHPSTHRLFNSPPVPLASTFACPPPAFTHHSTEQKASPSISRSVCAVKLLADAAFSHLCRGATDNALRAVRRFCSILDEFPGIMR